MPKKKIFIEALEQRIMLDGAGASTFLDIVDESNKEKLSQKASKEAVKFKEIRSTENTNELPFTNLTRDKIRKKQVVFIDKQIQDYEVLIETLDKNTKVILIESNEDGFKKIEQTLGNGKKYSAIHIIGHGSAGQILFGNALLTNENIENYNSTLKNIGKSLTSKGDILFYGCNIAANEKGENLIKRISKITKADIAASDDVTGKSGDWKLEHKVGNIESKNIKQVNYMHDLVRYTTTSNSTSAPKVDVGADGITHIRGAMSAFTGTTDRDAIDFTTSKEHNNGTGTQAKKNYITYTGEGSFGEAQWNQTTNHVDRFITVLERTGITSGSIDALRPDNHRSGDRTSSQWSAHDTVTINDSDSTHYLLSNSTPMDVYMVMLDSHFDDKTHRYERIGEVKFDREIVGILIGRYQTEDMSSQTGNMDLHNPNNSTYPDTTNASSSTRGFENLNWRKFKDGSGATRGYGQGNNSSGSKSGDWIAVSDDKRTLHVACKNIGGGDLIRVLVKGQATNSSPTAADNTGIVNENGSLAVDNGDAAVNKENNTITLDTNDAFNIAASGNGQETNPAGLAFNNDGTKMFITGPGGDKVYEYSLSTAFDVSSASYAGSAQDLDVSGETAAPYGLNFNNDGTKLYVVGGGKIHQYTLNTPYDVSDVNGSAFTLDPTGFDSTPTGLTFNNDGTKVFVAGFNSRVIEVLHLSTAYDLSGTVTYDSSSSSHRLDVSSYVSRPRDVQFNKDGTRMFVMDGAGAGTDITEYELTTGFDVTTASYHDEYDISAQPSQVETQPFGFKFNNIGTKLFVVGYNSDKVNEYNLVSPYNLIDVDGEHDGDVLEDDNDTDSSDVLIVSEVGTGSTENNASSANVGSALTGTYGQLTLNANGSYTYNANQSAAEALDAGDVVVDYFNYTVSDQNGGEDYAVLAITVIGMNDDVTAVNDTDSVDEDDFVIKTSSQDDVLNDDTDPDDMDTSATLLVTGIKAGTGSGASTAVNPGTSYNSSGTSITGTYGTLIIGADGSYKYTADQSAADALDAGDQVTDVFTYTVYDGADEDTATLTITVTGINDDPMAQNDEGFIDEGQTLTVSDGDDKNASGAIDADDEHSGDVIHTSSSTHLDSDADASASLFVSVIRTGSTENSGTIGVLGSPLSGTYGSLTMNANGSYTYVANNNISGLYSGSSVNDVFNYTVSDNTGEDHALLTITILGSGSLTAVNDTDSVNEDATVFKTGAQDDLLNDDSGDSITVTQVKPNGGSYSSVQASSTYNSNGTQITGTYGTITFGADGSYTYTADQSAATAMEAGQTETDVFVYEITDSSGGTTTATLTITVTGVNDAPTALNDFGAINEGATLTVSDGDNKNASGAIDATGEHSGDVIHTSSSSNQDTDPDVNPTLTVSEIRKGNVEGSGDAGTVGQSLSGTYGALTINANGSYTYIANSDITGLYSGDSRTEYFNYTLRDEDNLTDKAVLEITILGQGDPPPNNAPVARNDEGYINEGLTLTVSDGDNPNVSGSYDATGEHTGDVINTNRTSNYDTDADGHTLIISSVRTGSIEGSGNLGSVGTSLTGTYGQLTLNANGSYTYNANQSAANALASGESATDSFNYTVSDQNGGTDTAVLTITIYGLNDGPTAVNDTDSVDEDGTVQKTGSQDDALNDDTDPDSSDSLVVTHIQPGSGSTSTVSSSSTYDSNGTSVTGTYGTLTIGADGSYTYTADQSAADDLDKDDQVTDVFTYTISDGNGGTDTATITITVTGINDNPVAQDDFGVIGEDDTLSVSNGSNASVTGDYDAVGEHSGDVIDTSSSSSTDSDPDDDNASLSISEIRTGRKTGSGTSGTVGQALTGTYGQLTLLADGSYTYVANQDAADALSASGAYDYFTYTLKDEHNATATAEIRILVLGDDNDRPTATDGTVYINENNTDGTHGTRTASNITYTFSSNGSEFNYSDVENDTFTKIRIKSLPSSGTLHRLDANGFITGTYSINDFVENFERIHYVPDANSEADDSFEYRVNDGSLTSASNNTMNILVNAAPVAVSDTDSITAGNSAETGNVITNDTDSDDSTSVMTITGVGAGTESSTLPNRNVGSAVSGTYGTLTLNSNGSYSYDVSGNSATALLANGATATDVFSYKVKDDETNAGTKALDIGIITFTITGIEEGVTANNDSISFDMSATKVKTVSNGDTNDAESNDSSNGDGDTLTITTFRPGAVEGSGTSENAGSSVVGNYGSLKLNADGSYTYTVNETQLDAENPEIGQLFTDYFNYTISDGNGNSDIAVITIQFTFGNYVGGGGGDQADPGDGPEGEESGSDKKGKGKQNKDSKNERKQRRSEKIDTPELELPPSNTRDAAEFNQGLKLVDLVAESKSVDISGNEDIDTLKAKFTKEGMRIKFKVFNDEGKEIQKYYGVMKDGSPLPKWIKVDTKTGKTVTNIPKGMQTVEFKIVAIDLDNNEKQVTVVIDPKKIAQDKDILKQIRKSKKTKVDVRTDGSVRLESKDQTGSIDQTTSKVLNNNKFEDFSKLQPTETLDLETKSIENKFILDLPDDVISNFKEIKVLQEDGNEVPDWIKVDIITGQITAEPPKEISNIKLKIIVENKDGEISVKEVELEFKKENANTGKLIDPETTFESLNVQLAKEKVNFDDYGDKIIRSL